MTSSHAANAMVPMIETKTAVATPTAAAANIERREKRPAIAAPNRAEKRINDQEPRLPEPSGGTSSTNPNPVKIDAGTKILAARKAETAFRVLKRCREVSVT